MKPRKRNNWPWLGQSDGWWFWSNGSRGPRSKLRLRGLLLLWWALHLPTKATKNIKFRVKSPIMNQIFPCLDLYKLSKNTFVPLFPTKCSENIDETTNFSFFEKMNRGENKKKMKFTSTVFGFFAFFIVLAFFTLFAFFGC